MTRTLALDFPQLTRTAVGFNRLFNDIERSYANSQSTNYPPYNVVEISEDEWTISLAVAGFDMNDLDITLDKNVLTVEGNVAKDGEEVKYLHKGIGTRNFRRQFMLADHIEVSSATLKLGMLNINLVRNVPEELQPKKIAISTSESEG